MAGTGGGWGVRGLCRNPEGSLHPCGATVSGHSGEDRRRVVVRCVVGSVAGERLGGRCGAGIGWAGLEGKGDWPDGDLSAVTRAAAALRRDGPAFAGRLLPGRPMAVAVTRAAAALRRDGPAFAGRLLPGRPMAVAVTRAAAALRRDGPAFTGRLLPGRPMAVAVTGGHSPLPGQPTAPKDASPASPPGQREPPAGPEPQSFSRSPSKVRYTSRIRASRSGSGVDQRPRSAASVRRSMMPRRAQGLASFRNCWLTSSRT
ncbi:hypothetical protein ATK36_5216 [Amycolatopsis sulphurea]|uniref:Uncharacterized protein n=1 Tax=Amycolatopsis sulphurea TaxID=76022 RepID=A0A2A9FF60_9PSEU|nr:hypothetical protein ATK36_5216 [Amycolatopsis sulphurea]